MGQTKRVKRKKRKKKGGKINKEEGISLLLLMCCNPNVQCCFLSFRLIEKNQISNLLAFLNAISNPLGYRLLPTTMLNQSIVDKCCFARGVGRRIKKVSYVSKVHVYSILLIIISYIIYMHYFSYYVDSIVVQEKHIIRGMTRI